MTNQVINRLREIFDIGIWSEWFVQLDRPFVFLLSLPLVVAIVGLWSAWRDRENEEDKE